MTFDDLTAQDLQRVNVVGLSGSGKSTFANRLASALSVEYIEMDRIFHGPNWTEPSEAVFRTRVSKAIAGDRWVLDGNYHSKTYDIKWERATAIVWLNTPFVRNLWQSTRRTIHRSLTKQELWPGTGNRETLRRSFFCRESILLWAIMNYGRIQRRYSAIKQDPAWSHLRFCELRSRRDANDFLNKTAKHKDGGVSSSSLV